MKKELKSNEEAVAVAKRMVWLAYQASVPMGLGFFAAVGRDNETEETVWDQVKHAAQDPQKFTVIGDYIFGRMMKLVVSVEGAAVLLTNSACRLDYQSWCGTYPTYEALFDAAGASLLKEETSHANA